MMTPPAAMRGCPSKICLINCEVSANDGILDVNDASETEEYSVLFEIQELHIELYLHCGAMLLVTVDDEHVVEDPVSDIEFPWIEPIGTQSLSTTSTPFFQELYPLNSSGWTPALLVCNAIQKG